ncbi:MAG: hypothetical protein JWM78_1001, partial [Verrucomicrobiaceae bacterium]|nr:hypothetical protein [Verrucomicrobiaceae bacterium]
MNNNKKIDSSNYDRRSEWKPSPRPDWMATLNQLGENLDIKSIVPLSSTSLINQAVSNAGLSDFGGGRWLQ